MQPESQAQPQGGSPSRKRKRRWPYILLGLVGFLVFACAWIFWPATAPPLQIAKDTTYLTGPLNQDGTVNYVAALNEILSEGVTPENNAAVVLAKALGPDLISNEKVRPAVLVQLGVGPLPKEGPYFVPLAEYVRKQRPDLLEGKEPGAAGAVSADEVEWRMMESLDKEPSAEDRSLVGAWLAANELPLALVVEATQKRCFFVPYGSAANPPEVLDGMCTNYRLLRQAGRAMGMRAALRILDGDFESAWRDTQALYRLAWLCGYQPTFVGYLGGVSLDVLASGVSIRIANHPRISADRARIILREFLTLPAFPDVKRVGDLGERCMILDGVSQIMRNPASPLLSQAGKPLYHGPVDFNHVLRRVNTCVDAILAPLRVEGYAERQSLSREVGNGIVQEIARMAGEMTGIRGKLCYAASPPGIRMRLLSDAIANLVLAVTLPSIERVDRSREAAAMWRCLSEIAFALTVYNAEKGGYPATLDQLVPDYLPQLPIDAFSGKPLIYKPSGEGYLLYSVGSNGQDNGGQKGDSSELDDLVVRVGPAASPPARSASGAPQTAVSE